jgi:hypothetical protein
MDSFQSVFTYFAGTQDELDRLWLVTDVGWHWVQQDKLKLEWNYYWFVTHFEH